MSPKYREFVAQLLTRELFITDGGIETTLVFDKGLDLPCFAAYTLLKTEEGTKQLRDAYAIYAKTAEQYSTNVLFESPTWRATKDWGDKMGYTEKQLEQAIEQSIGLLESIRHEYEPATGKKLIISGCIGPRGDGYVVDKTMTVDQAEAYHANHIKTFAEKTNADLVSGLTLTYPEEAIGLAKAARRCDMPCVISFTVETDGKLPNGQSLKEAIDQVDAATDKYPAYYMINCAHPTHFQDIFDESDSKEWTKRISAVRANASCKSHAELDEATELDAGNPVELAAQTRSLHAKLPNLTVLGGCCGTDHRHIEAICKEISSSARQ
jgi:S-methylmethionine-dependent homocysteine/selenocysteine methylase